MREIKFRGKRLDNGEWVYGYLWINKTATAETVYIMTNNGEYMRVHQASAGQYTGMKDCNGKEIYEGGVIKIKITDRKFDKVIADKNTKVYFKNGIYGFEWGKDFTTFSDFDNICCTFKIIENAYENPELMEEEQ